VEEEIKEIWSINEGLAAEQTGYKIDEAVGIVTLYNRRLNIT